MWILLHGTAYGAVTECWDGQSEVFMNFYTILNEVQTWHTRPVRLYATTACHTLPFPRCICVSVVWVSLWDLRLWWRRWTTPTSWWTSRVISQKAAGKAAATRTALSGRLFLFYRKKLIIPHPAFLAAEAAADNSVSWLLFFPANIRSEQISSRRVLLRSFAQMH